MEIYLVQLQIQGSKEQPTAPVAVSADVLQKFIDENLRPGVVMLISSIKCYE